MKMTTWNELGGNKRGLHLKLVERRIDFTLIQESNDRGISRGYKRQYGAVPSERAAGGTSRTTITWNKSLCGLKSLYSSKIWEAQHRYESQVKLLPITHPFS